MRDFKLNHVAIALSFALIACQDTDIQIEEQVDQDMEVALSLASDYMSSARTEGDADRDVTVIRRSLDLFYKTNDSNDPYIIIEEETITAISSRGGYVFWYPGEGVQKLVGIEFDDRALAILQTKPRKMDNGMWVLNIPSDIKIEGEGVLLKYDIVYETTDGEVIRLDPKLQVKNLR